MLDSSVEFRFFLCRFRPFAVFGGDKFIAYLSVREIKRLCGLQGASETQAPNQAVTPLSKNAKGVARKKFFKTPRRQQVKKAVEIFFAKKYRKYNM